MRYFAKIKKEEGGWGEKKMTIKTLEELCLLAIWNMRMGNTIDWTEWVICSKERIEMWVWKLNLRKPLKKHIERNYQHVQVKLNIQEICVLA
jgi:hypothetical protein